MFRMLTVLSLSLALCPALYAATHYVPDDFAAIQEAINSPLVMNGDTVIVRAGTWYENINFKGKAIHVKSESGPDVTTIDGRRLNTVVTFDYGEGPDSILDGFTITNGHAAVAGGILCFFPSSPTIRNNMVIGNTSVEDCGGVMTVQSDAVIEYNVIQLNQALGEYGGGVYIDGASPIISHNEILDNDCALEGGGIFCGGATTAVVENNTVSGNFAVMGGGIFCCNCSPLLRGNVIKDNTAQKAGGGIVSKNYSAPLIMENVITSNTAIELWGGGIFCPSSAAEIIGNTISQNVAQYGGGLCCSFLTSTVSENLIFENHALLEGGGVYCNKSNSTYANNSIYSNQAERGGGMFLYESSPIITNCTAYGNTAQVDGGGLCGTNGYFPAVMNCIIWNNTPDPVKDIHQVNYCDLEGGWVGPGNISQDPGFVDAAIGDFHLTWTSPCRDMGWNNGAALPDLDYEGDPRITDGFTDMGADEYHIRLYCTGDVTPGGSIQGKFVGSPGTAPVGLWLGAGVLEDPLHSAFGPWYLMAPFIGPLTLPPIPGNGVLKIPATLPLLPEAPYDLPMQAIVGSALTNPCVLEVR
jgi:hypothetical protein